MNAPVFDIHAFAISGWNCLGQILLLLALCLRGCWIAGFLSFWKAGRHPHPVDLKPQEVPNTEAACHSEAPAQSDEGSATAAAENSAENLFALRSARRTGAFRSTLCIGGTSGLLLFALIVGIENYGMTPIAHHAREMLQTQNGMTVDFDAVEGGLLRGEFVLRNVRIARQSHTGANFNLACATVRARCSIASLLSGRPIINEMLLTNATGTFDIPKRPEIPIGNRPPEATNSPASNGRSIQLDRLRIVDSQIQFSDHSVEGPPVAFVLAMKSLDCSSFQSERAPYDILFRSQFEGSLDGLPLRINTKNSPSGDRTEWRAEKLPVSLLRAYFGGPFRWLSAGTFDVETIQFVPAAPEQPVTLSTRLTIDNAKAEVPAGLRPAVAIGAQFLVDHLNQRTAPLDLRFQVDLDRKRFDLRTTESLDHLWSQFRTSAIAALFKASGNKLDFVADLVGAENNDEAIDKVSKLTEQVLERIRQRRRAKRGLK